MKTAAILILLVPGVALAQTAPAQGPLVVERVHNPFVVAPDYIGGNRNVTRFGTDGRGGAQPTSIRLRAQDDFFVFEPQANVLTRISDHVGLQWAGGYRLTALDDFLDDRVNGPIGSVALQLEW